MLEELKPGTIDANAPCIEVYHSQPGAKETHVISWIKGGRGGRQGGWIRFSGRLHLDPSKPWQTFVSVEQRPKEAGLPTSRAAHEADLTEHCPLHGCAYYRLSPPCDGQAPGGGSPSAPELEKGKTENFADALSSHTCRRLHLYTDTHTHILVYIHVHTYTYGKSGCCCCCRCCFTVVAKHVYFAAVGGGEFF